MTTPAIASSWRQRSVRQVISITMLLCIGQGGVTAANESDTDHVQSSSVDARKVSPLLDIRWTGGLCAGPSIGHVCRSRVVVYRDGSYRSSGDVTQPTQGSLDHQLIERLESAINEANFNEIRSKPFTGVCPSAYDGQEGLYEFSTSHGNEVIGSCKTNIDYKSKLFKVVDESYESILRSINTTP